MKKLLLLIFALVLSSQTIKAQVVLDANGVTIKWTGTTVPSPYLIQASPRGTLEWFAIVNNSTKSKITEYAKNNPVGKNYFIPPGSSTPIAFNNIVTTLVTDMSRMFYYDGFYYFNYPLESWDVSNVTNMSAMFNLAKDFDQNISYWNVSKVTNMSSMFWNATTFNQPIGSWDVSNVTNMTGMFKLAKRFDQNISSWNVSKVSNMSAMFSDVMLSTDNYDALLTGWSTITSSETPLKIGVEFSAGSSKYCNGVSFRSSLINTYGWTITDGGIDCSSLGIEELEISKLKLYPNPAVSELNVAIDYHLIDEPYIIFDGLGRIVLEGKFKEVESTINLKELSKGIYYVKVSDSHSSKFIKE
jgi:surface protein